VSENKKGSLGFSPFGEARKEVERESPASVLNKLSNLPKFKQVSRFRYVACCPAHDDRNPSLSITDADDKILVHCFSGCSQDEVLNALRDQGMWAEASTRWVRDFSADDLDYMMHWCLVYHGAFRRGEKLRGMDSEKLQEFVNVLQNHSAWRYKVVEEDAYRVS
tara:strand:+ start:72 stop:563 length:492 start_codon:yes stop_codon:yes gene_type:complete